MSQEEKNILDELLEEGDENPLNLTAEDKDQGEQHQMAGKVNAQFEKFLHEMQGNSGENEMDGLTSMLGGLLKELSTTLEGHAPPTEQDLKTAFSAEDPSSIEDITTKLFSVFMKKDLLFEPLMESKASYEKYFKENPDDKENQRYRKQHQLIIQILDVLQKTPQNTQLLMKMFQKMPDYGQPPKGIVSLDLPTI